MKNTIQIFHKHNWQIVEVDDRVKLPTSDDPVVCLNYYEKNNYDFGGGWDTKGSEIIFPISPNKLIYTQVGNSENISSKFNYQLSMGIKRMIIDILWLK